MGQVFKPRANTFFRMALLALVLVPAAVGVFAYLFQRSSYWTRVGVALDQPVPFSHAHHVGGLGIDCRYCHTSAATSSFAGLPPTATCMTCHSQVWKDAPVLAPVRESLRTGQPIVWNRVHNLPGYVYFNHSIHVNKGVGCTTCHGAIGEMPITWKSASLEMQWCLNCHRHPERYLRPQAEVFNPAWHPPAWREQLRFGTARVIAEKIDRAQMTSCSTCHH